MQERSYVSVAGRRVEGVGACVDSVLMAHSFGLILGPVSESARDGTPTGRLFMQRRLLSADFKAI